MPAKKKAAKSKAARQADRQRKVHTTYFRLHALAGLLVEPPSPSLLQAEQLLSASIPSGFIGNLDDAQRSGGLARCCCFSIFLSLL
jgi:hypothetical protein